MKYLHFSEKRRAARELWDFIFVEWSYGIEVLGRNSSEDRGLCGGPSTELKVLYEHWDKVWSLSLKRCPCQGSRDMLWALLQLQDWNCLQVGEEWYESSSTAWFPVCVCVHPWLASRQEGAVHPLGHRFQLLFPSTTSAPRATRCRGLFPSRKPLWCVWPCETERFALLGKRSPCNRFCFKSPGSHCLWRASSHKPLHGFTHTCDSSGLLGPCTADGTGNMTESCSLWKGWAVHILKTATWVQENTGG